MKTREKILPNCIVKRIHPGDEDKEVSSAIVAALAMYIVGVVFIYYWGPFGDGNRWKETCLVICILAILIALGYMLVARVSLLERKRKRAIKAYAKAKKNEKEAKTEEARIKAKEWKASLEDELEELHVPLDCEAIKKRQKELERSNANGIALLTNLLQKTLGMILFLEFFIFNNSYLVFIKMLDTGE